MKIITKNIDDLIPSLYNPRKELKPGDKEYEKLKRSIETFGYVEPIIWNKQTNTVVGGHQRLTVLKNLGHKTVDVVEVDLDLNNEKALNVALNKVSGEWDAEKLEDLLRELDVDTDLDVTLTGFDLDELNTLYSGAMKELDELEEDDDKQCKNKKCKDIDDGFEIDDEELNKRVAKSKLGDLYKLGSHYVLCGDAKSLKDIQSLTSGKSIDICITSPPYGMGTSAKLRNGSFDNNNTGYINKETESLYNGYSDTPDEWNELIRETLDNMLKVSTQQFVNIQMLANNKINLVEILYDYRENLCDIIMWNKHRAVPQIARNILNSGFEFIFVFANNKVNKAIKFGDFQGTKSNVIDVTPGHNNYADIHKAVYPVNLVNEILDINSKCETVFDPFGGTGTTLIACEANKKTCYTMDIDPLYVDIIIERWEEYTGKKAEFIRNIRSGDING